MSDDIWDFPPEVIQRLRKEMERQSVSLAEAAYAETGNPVYAWEAIRDCLASSGELPEWTKRYLLDVATKLHLSRTHVPAKATIQRAIAEAFGVSGRGRGVNVFRSASSPAHEFRIALEVYRYKLGHSNYDWNSIFKDVAQAHGSKCRHCQKQMTAATVKRHWYRHALDVIPKHLIERAKSKKIDDILR